MGSVVTVMNMKGGVGKTTVTLNLGGIFGNYKIGSRRRKVLLIDYDPQFNLSQSFLEPKVYRTLEKAGKTCLRILQDDEADVDPFELQVPGSHEPPKLADVVHSVHAGKESQLHIIPSTLDLMYVALGQSQKRIQPIEERFSKFIASAKSKYDLVLIDCHPAGSLLTKTSLQNSDHVIIPVSPQRYAYRGIGLMMQFIKAKRLGGTSPQPHILFNNVPRKYKTDEETEIRAIPDLKEVCMIHTVKKFKAFEEPFDGSGFCWQSKKPYSTEAFNNLLEVSSEFAIRAGLG